MSSCSSWCSASTLSSSSGDADSDYLSEASHSSSLTSQTTSRYTTSSLATTSSSSEDDLSISSEEEEVPIPMPRATPLRKRLILRRPQKRPLLIKQRPTPDMIDDVHSFSSRIAGEPLKKPAVCQNRLFYDTLFEKFPSNRVSKRTEVRSARVTDCNHQKIIDLDALKKEICQRKICQKLDIAWSEPVYERYRFDKHDWQALTSAWKADSLTRDLLVGMLMTTEDYQRISLKDKKKLLVIFHPDKNRQGQLERLYGIVFKKINKLYNQ